jgi:hypothetical protein
MGVANDHYHRYLEDAALAWEEQNLVYRKSESSCLDHYFLN